MQLTPAKTAPFPTNFPNHSQTQNNTNKHKHTLPPSPFFYIKNTPIAEKQELSSPPVKSETNQLKFWIFQSKTKTLSTISSKTHVRNGKREREDLPTAEEMSISRTSVLRVCLHYEYDRTIKSTCKKQILLSPSQTLLELSESLSYRMMEFHLILIHHGRWRMHLL